MRDALHWLAVHTGSDRTAGPSVFYNFFSGFGSDLTELTVVGSVVAAARHKNCHVKGCWHLGHADRDGVIICRRCRSEGRRP